MRAISLIQGPLRGALLRQTLFVVPSLALAWLCVSNLGLAPSDLATGLADVSATRWLAGMAFTALGFWVIGRYDLLVHRHLATGIDPTRARRTGAAAIAISQTTGFGLVVGALVRWRLLPHLGMPGALRLVALVSATFIATWAVLASVAVLLTPSLALPVPASRIIAGCVLILGFAAGVACLVRPGFCARLKLPSVRTLASLLTLTSADLVAAAMAFVCFLPIMPGTGVLEIMTAFTIAYGVGLISGSPGGIGPFEIVLFALLPGADPAGLVAAIAGWRIVYFALPAMLGLIALARGPKDAPCAPLDQPVAVPEDWMTGVVATAPRAEAGLLHAGHAGLLYRSGQPLAVVARASNSLVLLSSLTGASERLCKAMTIAAKESGRFPCLYKIGSRQAASARQEGWSVARCGAEAFLTPLDWTENGADRAGLRRKLRRAQKAGITTEEAHASDDDLRRLDAAWSAAQGPARGFTMGRYGPDYVRHQRVFVARLDGRICAFVTFHCCADEWVLDLVRHDGSPDGTIHALICHAIEAARSVGCPRLSLAAVPTPPTALPSRLAARCARHMGTAGLMQFKASFAPRWEARYIAAPGPIALAICWADIAQCVTRSPRTRGDQRTTQRPLRPLSTSAA